ncbi:MAG: 16S rRNA (cytosine(967)-C(5))-methyltransferase RsmB [Oscillibacter sp.]|nr:16S rRNA (cytosine(967)-C(5))-methyltransferase RsmB [Oscillibacter sp.]
MPSATKQPPSARDTALDILTACRRQNAWADAALNARLGLVAMPATEAALCARLVYGVLQSRILLDFYLNAFCTQKVSHLQEPLADILRLGAYQILFLDRVPDHAAVNEAVKQSVRAGRKPASGMVNAVLRRLSREKASLPAIPDAATRYSHPRWIVERVGAILGAEETERFLAANNQIPPITVRVNTERTTPEALLSELPGAARHPWVPDCLELSGGGAVTGLQAFRAGKFYVQDAAARLVTHVAGITRGQSVLDVCAAPGGKSFGAALNGGAVLSCDVNANKLQRIADGAARLGLAGRIRTERADGREFRPEWESKFDTVLVDAPCSGLGIIRKKPDIRYRDPAALLELPELQYAILRNAARYVRPGGVLVYSTCTILPEENERVTDRFLSEATDFRRASFALPGRGDFPGQVTLWPQRDNTDGFYICRMERGAT